MTWFQTQLLGTLILPPASLLILAFLGLALFFRRPRVGFTLTLVALSALYALSTPALSTALLHSLERFPPWAAQQPEEVQAIVILGAGKYVGAPEYSGDTVNDLALARLRYGARLQRATGLPILVTGGNPAGGPPEAPIMAAFLREELHVPVRWVEARARNSRENAQLSARMLVSEGITHVLLVSHAWHMPRAIPEFERAGLSVTPAPTGFTTNESWDALDFIPRASALTRSFYALHEYLGLLWYRMTQ